MNLAEGNITVICETTFSQKGGIFFWSASNIDTKHEREVLVEI